MSTSTIPWPARTCTSTSRSSRCAKPSRPRSSTATCTATAATSTEVPRPPARRRGLCCNPPVRSGGLSMSRLLLAAFFAVLVLCPLSGPRAQSTQAEAGPGQAGPDAAQAPAAPRAIDADDLSAYVDGLVDAAMRRDGIAGVTVAIVDREGPLLLRGYGLAAQSPRRAVDAAGTLFRIASISKTFTYLLALQLVDQGRLDLDDPVNDHLPPALALPDDGYPPVRVRHLLTHTAGFEDTAMGHLFVDRPERVLPMADYLQRHRPRRVRPPGTVAVYSNYSVALLGAMLAQVTGTGFDALAGQRLFGPMD